MRRGSVARVDSTFPAICEVTAQRARTHRDGVQMRMYARRPEVSEGGLEHRLTARPLLIKPSVLRPSAGAGYALPEDLQTTWDRMREEMRTEVTDFIFHVWI